MRIPRQKETGQALLRLARIMARLRGKGGCPWDREQDHKSLLKCLIEECYEFYEATLDHDHAKMCEELGDIMLQIVFHAQMAREAGRFDLCDVLTGIGDKLVRRHPHVFGSVAVRDSGEVLSNWERIKQNEKGGKARRSVLDGVPRHMPAVLKALKIQKRAAKVGFDWRTAGPILGKIREEIRELKAEMGRKRPRRIKEEVGDVLFSVVNLARHLNVDPEEALSATNRKFTARFKRMERRIRGQGKRLHTLPLRQLDAFWEAEKLK
jgi:tetrapyrrole methylase family protein/MazG family protein